MWVGQMSCFVNVHEASRNVVVHHPHLISRLLFPLIGFFLCVLVYSNSCCRLSTGGCWIALRVKWAWACGGSYYSDGVVLSRHIRWLYASGWFVGEGMSCG